MATSDQAISEDLRRHNLSASLANDVDLGDVPLADQGYVREIITQMYKFIWPTPALEIGVNVTADHYNISIRNMQKPISWRKFDKKFMDTKERDAEFTFLDDITFQSYPTHAFVMKIQKRTFHESATTTLVRTHTVTPTRPSTGRGSVGARRRTLTPRAAQPVTTSYRRRRRK